MRTKLPSRILQPLTATLLCGATLSAQAVCDFLPTAPEVVLNTSFGVVHTSCGPVQVAGGIYQFRNVVIPAGVRVRGSGPNPLIILATGSVTIDGELSVRGGDGQRVDTLNSANFPSIGGRAVCGGSDGGMGSPSSVSRSPSGQQGWSFANSQNLGGFPGLLSCAQNCGRGSAGGGGSFATAGDPHYLVLSNGTANIQQLGVGGSGCTSSSVSLPGGAPGSAVFVDGIPDNDFLGTGVNVFRRSLVRGELSALIGGQGGGGGGDLSWQGCTILDPNFHNDAKGGGGGAGGGVVILFAAGLVHIGGDGRIDADGGNGGGGEQAGGNTHGGGGGGGSGGLVIVGSSTGIEFVAHGETYANNDFSFAVSADGGAGLQGVFGGSEIRSKYDRVGFNWPSRPVGGLGGMGIVQFVTPIGANQDGTNTILDDHVHVVQNGARLTGAQKQRYLAWRGYFDAARATYVDDAGLPTNIGRNEGDIRPSPILIPLL
ncbi:MAG: hypothetical protein AB7I19_02680 [Planctomycetota bacterium]